MNERGADHWRFSEHNRWEDRSLYVRVNDSSEQEHRLFTRFASAMNVLRLKMFTRTPRSSMSRYDATLICSAVMKIGISTGYSDKNWVSLQ